MSGDQDGDGSTTIKDFWAALDTAPCTCIFTNTTYRTERYLGLDAHIICTAGSFTLCSAAAFYLLSRHQARTGSTAFENGIARLQRKIARLNSGDAALGALLFSIMKW